MPILAFSQLFGTPEYLNLRQAAPFVTTFADVDLDGDLDIISAAYGDEPNILWVENLNNEHFRYHIVEQTCAPRFVSGIMIKE